MKKFLLAGVAAAAMFGGSTPAYATTECAVSAHDPVTTTTEHIGVAHALCASDGASNVTVRACMQMFRNVRWESLGCGAPVYKSFTTSADVIATVAIRCGTIGEWPHIQGMPNGTGLYRTVASASWPGGASTTTSAATPLACLGT